MASLPLPVSVSWGVAYHTIFNWAGMAMIGSVIAVTRMSVFFVRAGLISLMLAFNSTATADVSTMLHARTTPYSAAQLQQVVNEAYARFKGDKDGKNADYIPILTTVPSELFGVVITMRDGRIFAAGDVDYTFAIESTAKPFIAALAIQQYGGPQVIVDKIGVEPTGLPFNSKLAIEI
jgi:hypothetical protein